MGQGFRQRRQAGAAHRHQVAGWDPSMTEAQIPFRKDMAFAYGVPDQVSPLIRRVVAENPTPFTFRGTNTYIVGRGIVAIIDPGPGLPAHIDAVAAAVAGETVSHVFVTHTHLDHCEGAVALHRRIGGTLVGAHPRPLPAGAKTTESIDRGFAPDLVLEDNATFEGDGWTLTAVHTPGHMSNHHCFALAEETALFSGDHVMGWNTTIVSPPDGNMREYMASLKRCIERDDAIYWPGHGPEIVAPQGYVRALHGHRRMRETEIRGCLAKGARTIPEMVAVMYRHLPEPMHRAAARAVLAHLEHMVETGRAATDGPATAEATYRLP
jgi:glyoxylase-like metal-dependent hydrolase (beta-lactamase superfamily II)